MTNLYYTINATGRAQIVDFLAKYHKHPEDQNINGWVDDAETNMRNNGPDATIEILFFAAKSGHTETLTIERADGMDAHETEE